MQHLETKEFVTFKEYHFNAKEIEAYRMLLTGFMDSTHRKGLVEGFIYKDEEKKYHLYFYRGRKAFYTILAHIERKGEPKKDFQRTSKIMFSI